MSRTYPEGRPPEKGQDNQGICCETCRYSEESIGLMHIVWCDIREKYVPMGDPGCQNWKERRWND